MSTNDEKNEEQIKRKRLSITGIDASHLMRNIIKNKINNVNEKDLLTVDRKVKILSAINEDEDQEKKSEKIVEKRIMRLPTIIKTRAKSFRGELHKIQEKEEAYSNKKILKLGDLDQNELAKQYLIAFSCKKGLKPESPNQDDQIVLLYDQQTICAVFDGHGQQGHDVSDFCTNRLHIHLINLIEKNESIEIALKKSFVQTQADLVRECNQETGDFDAVLSGTTALVIVIDNKKKVIQSACAGDSKAILGSKVKNKLLIKDLTIEHKPDLPSEKKRILKAGGEVIKKRREFSHRVYVKYRKFPGLAMSRSLGDFVAHMVGVSCIPDVFRQNISDNDEFIFLASDGVWEFLTSNEVGTLVYTQGKDQLQDGCENITQKAWDLWIKNEKNVVDDITAIIIQLKK